MNRRLGMSMSHKAYVFDWQRFERELAALLMRSLTDGDAQGLIQFGNERLSALSNPYEGQLLASGWLGTLEVADVHEVADYVLTNYYTPTEDWGIGDSWLVVKEGLDAPHKSALLGNPFGPANNQFDPGRMGAYFQDEAMCRRSFALLNATKEEALGPFLAGLQRAIQSGKGVYVTF